MQIRQSTDRGRLAHFGRPSAKRFISNEPLLVAIKLVPVPGEGEKLWPSIEQTVNVSASEVKHYLAMIQDELGVILPQPDNGAV